MGRTILYHAHCPDGFGAAWAAWRRFGDSGTYLPVQHGAPPPEIAEGDEVYILDFSYSRAQTEEMRARFRNLTVIDHHGTAEVELSGLPYALFDNSKSACVMAWEFFHPGEPVPELLRYVMDKDLWLHRLEKSREVSAALSSYPADFRVWSELDVARLAEEGIAILRFQHELVALVCEQARFEELLGHSVPVVNTPLLGSEVGAELLKRYPKAPFAVIYFDRSDGKRQWSLRSREGFDVSKVARLFQNGGHQQAAGFETDLPEDFMPVPSPPSKKKRGN